MRRQNLYRIYTEETSCASAVVAIARRATTGSAKKRIGFIVSPSETEISCARRRQVRQPADCALLSCR
jgi:hypothetical protein